MSGIQLHIDPATLESLLERAAERAALRVQADQVRLGDKLCYSEEEAARLLGLKAHNLRDARLRGQIQASQITGRRIRYTRDDLLRYLSDNRWDGR